MEGQSHRARSLFRRASYGMLLVAALATAPERLTAQQRPLQPKRALSSASTLPCPAPPSTPVARRDSPEVRRLVTLGHEAAIVGDHRQARDVFAQAAALNPGDERIAYQLGRAHEELGDRPAAVREYCRFLALAPQSSDAADVQARLTALSSASASAAARQAPVMFGVGVGHLDQRRWREAVDAFGRVLQGAPRAAEAYYNRALALAALDRRDEAARDFEQYLTMRPGAEDQAPVRLQIDALRRPTWSTTTALVTGLVVPGLGQVYTSRPWVGLGIAAVAGSALYMAFRSEDQQEIRQFPGPFPGIVYEDTISVTKHPYYGAGLAAFAVVTVGAALEAGHYARRSRGPPGGFSRPPVARAGALELFAPSVGPGRDGLELRIRGRLNGLVP